MTDGIIIQRLDEQIVEGKRLGRHVRIDPRGRNYRVRPRTAATIRSRMWFGSNERALDQGGYGACIGFGSAHALNCEPWGLKLDNGAALDLYSVATANDVFDGVFPPDDTGSSVLGGMIACRNLGYIKGWENAYSIDDVLAALQTRPGIMGVSWFSGCDSPSGVDGRVSPSGTNRGGHCVAIVGCECETGTIICRNSWGDDYGVEHTGQTGYFRLSYLEFEALLNLTGEAAFPNAP